MPENMDDRGTVQFLELYPYTVIAALIVCFVHAAPAFSSCHNLPRTCHVHSQAVRVGLGLGLG